MIEKTFKYDARIILRNFTRSIDLGELPPLDFAFNRVTDIISNPEPQNRMQNDLGKAITLATDKSLETSATEVLAIMLNADSSHLPIEWRQDSELQRAIFSMTSSIESGILTAHAIWVERMSRSASLSKLRAKAARLQLLNQDLQAR